MISPMKICRQAQDIRLIHLAKQVGISEGWLSRIENGWAAAPLRLQGKISRALGVQVDTLWPRTEPDLSGPESVLLGGGNSMELERIIYWASQPEPQKKVKKGGKRAGRPAGSKNKTADAPPNAPEV
jgi:transcriptional regulator with XRE-family HTH domain